VPVRKPAGDYRGAEIQLAPNTAEISVWPRC